MERLVILKSLFRPSCKEGNGLKRGEVKIVDVFIGRCFEIFRDFVAKDLPTIFSKGPSRDFCQFCENGFSKCIANQDITLRELSQIILTTMAELVMGSGNHQHQI